MKNINSQIEQIDKLTKLSEKKTALLKELKQATIYSKMKYDLIKHENNRYSLFRIEDEKLIKHGTLGQIASFTRLRNIDKELIYKR